MIKFQHSASSASPKTKTKTAPTPPNGTTPKDTEAKVGQPTKNSSTNTAS